MSEAVTSEKRSGTWGGLNKTLLIPLGIFLILIVVLANGFNLDDPHLLPSVLIDRPFPAFELSELHDQERIVTGQDLIGERRFR